MPTHQPSNLAGLVARRARTGRLPAGAIALLFACAGLTRSARAEDPPEQEPPAPVLVAPTTSAKPEPAPMLPEAKAYYERGLDLYKARDFAAAVRALEQGYAVDPRREFLFAEAQALRLAGECARAIPLYRRFIDSGPEAVQAQAALLGIDRCAPERTPAKPAGTVPNPPPGDPTGTRPGWWRDPLALSAAGLGVAALGVGAALFVASQNSVDQAESPRTMTHMVYAQYWAEAVQRRDISIVSLAAGAGLVAAGGLRLWWVYRHPGPGAPNDGPPASLSFVPAPTGATLRWEGRF